MGVQEPVGPPPPAGFKEYKNNAASAGILSMIQQIIDDAKAMETEAVQNEEDAQVAYETFVKETNASIESKGKEIVNKSETKAKAEGDLVDTKQSKEATLVELGQLSQYNAELHQSCDFLIKNFDLRQTARRRSGSFEASEGHFVWSQVRTIFANRLVSLKLHVFCGTRGTSHIVHV